MELLTLREVCEAYHVSRRAVQGYERANLVSASSKNKYGYLFYDEAEQDRIAKIKQYQDMGFQIKEIKEIIDASDTALKEALIQRRESLQQEIIHTQRMLELINKMIQEL